MVPLAIVNMLLLILGFLMRLRKQKRTRAVTRQFDLAVKPLADAQEG